MTEFVYKVIDEQSWRQAEATGVFKGNADDLRDGFIHLSTSDQVARVLGKFFKGRAGLLLIEIPLDLIADGVKFEEASDGGLYPHIYGDLQTSAAGQAFALELDDDGRHILPWSEAQ